MGFLQFIMNLLNGGGQPPSETPYRAPRQQAPIPTGNPCANGCGQMTAWTGHNVCRTCWKQANLGLTTPSPSRMNSYNKVIAIAGSTGMSEAEFRTTLIDNRGFYDGDVDALCASPTVRRLMGWA